MSWTPVDSVNQRLPDGVRVYAGLNQALPLRAWYARIDEPAAAIETRVAVSDDPRDDRETVSSFAHDLGACVAVNGGYFAMGLTPTRHAGLLYADGRTVAGATVFVTRDSVRYPTVRAAIGFGAGGDIEIGWAIARRDTVFAWLDPPANRRGVPADPPRQAAATRWEVRDALGAGPMLVWDGEARVTSDEEVFFGTTIPDVHPRTAIGYDERGALVLLVVDGRQAASRGATLEETATIMRELGAVRALNLDGGGSSALVAAGTLLNQPSGTPEEREVMSAIVTFCGAR
jgi:exopolysaccharide biosynthesis protein